MYLDGYGILDHLKCNPALGEKASVWRNLKNPTVSGGDTIQVGVGTLVCG